VLSLAASFAGLLVVHRLVALERGARVAGLTVALLAFAPMAFTFSAVYTEGLFLLITAGAFLAARTDRWALAGALAMAASATRPNGLLLVVPLALLALHQGAGRRAGWLALAPLGVIAFSVYAAPSSATRWRGARPSRCSAATRSSPRCRRCGAPCAWAAS
jgi:Gpi18-like mannosyltransferase